MTWKDILKDSNTDIETKPSYLYAQNRNLTTEDRIEDVKRTMETIVPYKILIEDYQKQIAEYKEAIEKIKSLR